MDNSFRPVKYEKITHEKDYHAYEVVNFYSENGLSKAKCTRYRKNKPAQHVNLSSVSQAYDMVSVFYMLRNLDFAHLSKDKIYTTVVFSGKTKERVSIRYIGTQNIKLRDKSVHNAYHVKFNFTQDGRTKSSDDLDAWLSTDAARTPLMIVGKLPVGEVRCYLGGKYTD